MSTTGAQATRAGAMPDDEPGEVVVFSVHHKFMLHSIPILSGPMVPVAQLAEWRECGGLPL